MMPQVLARIHQKQQPRCRP